MDSKDRIHHASLLPVSQTSPALLHVMRQNLTMEMIEHVTNKVRSVVDIGDAEPESEEDAALLPTPPATPDDETKDPLEDASASDLPSLERYLVEIMRIHRVPIASLVVTVLYLERLKDRIPKMSKGLPCTRHRVLLATLIVASKYLNDATPKNKHWAKYNLFDLTEINLMERQLLFLLDFDVGFTEAEACDAFAPFLPTTAELRTAQKMHIPLQTLAEEKDEALATRSAAVNRVTKATASRSARLPITPIDEIPQPVLQQCSQPPPSSHPFPVLRNLGRRISSNLFRSASSSSISSNSETDECSNSSFSSSGDASTDSERSSAVYSSPDTSDMEEVDLNEDASCDDDEDEDSSDDEDDRELLAAARPFSRRGHRRNRTATAKASTRNDSTDSNDSMSSLPAPNVPLICQPRKVSGASTIGCRSPATGQYTPSPRRSVHAPTAHTAKTGRSVSHTTAPLTSSATSTSTAMTTSASSTGISTNTGTFSSLPRIRESVSAVFSGRVFSSSKHQQHQHDTQHGRRVQVRTNSEDVDVEKGFGPGRGGLSERVKDLKIACRAVGEGGYTLSEEY